MSDEESDEAFVEECRRRLQAMIDRVDLEAGSEEAMLDSASDAKRAVVEVIEGDLRELGHFDLRLPPGMPYAELMAAARKARRQWVYRHRDGRVFVLSLGQRAQLRKYGVARIYAFVEEPGN